MAERCPDDPAAVRALPGVGRYIAGAILSFAFDRPEPIVEANSQRVLARLLAIKENLKTASTQARIWQAAERLVPGSGAGTFNQALMELGALVCTPREPSCLVCPLSALCEARRLGLQDRLPITTPKPRPLAVTEACAIVVGEGKVLIVQRGRGGLWEQFWEFPTIHVDGVDPAGRSFERSGRPGRGRQATHGHLGRTWTALENAHLQRDQPPRGTERIPGESSERHARARARSRRCPLGRAGEVG